MFNLCNKVWIWRVWNIVWIVFSLALIISGTMYHYAKLYDVSDDVIYYCWYLLGYIAMVFGIITIALEGIIWMDKPKKE